MRSIPCYSLVKTDFSGAVFHSANFRHADCAMTTFDNAVVQDSSFLSANTKRASFTGARLCNVDFSRANLAHVDFTNATISNTHLESALSIRGARLPDGTRGRDPNLVKNGHADCTASVRDNWQVQMGDVATDTFRANQSRCRFVARPTNTGATMLQRISLAGIWDSTVWTKSEAILLARLTDGVSVQISGRTSTGDVLDKQILGKTSSSDCHHPYIFSIQSSMPATSPWRSVQLCRNWKYWSSLASKATQAMCTSIGGATISKFSLTMTPNGKLDDFFRVLLHSCCDLHFLQTLESKTLHTRSIKEKGTNERLKTIEHCQLREASLM